MHRLFLFILLVFPAVGQEYDLKDYLQLLKVAPGASVAERVQALGGFGITLSERGLRELSASSGRSPSSAAYSSQAPLNSVIEPAPQYPAFGPPRLRSSDGRAEKLGNLSSNPYDPDSVSNPYGQFGSPYSPNSINNPYGAYGSPYSPYSATNPNATQAPSIAAPTENIWANSVRIRTIPIRFRIHMGSMEAPTARIRFKIHTGNMEVRTRLTAFAIHLRSDNQCRALRQYPPYPHYRDCPRYRLYPRCLRTDVGQHGPALEPRYGYNVRCSGRSRQRPTPSLWFSRAWRRALRPVRIQAMEDLELSLRNSSLTMTRTLSSNFAGEILCA
jgi:hypothetical protein